MIDSHVHLWTPELVQASASAQAALRYFRITPEAIPDSLSALVEDLEAGGVDKAFLLAMDTRESTDEALRNLTVANEAVAEAVKEHPDLLIGFGSVDPRRGERAVEEMENAITGLGLWGLKFHASTLEVYPDDAKLMFPLYEKAIELGVPVIHHAGTTALGNCRIGYARPLAFDLVAESFPDLKVLLAHFGWPWMDECFAVLMRHQNLFTDISGWMPRYLPEAAVRMFNGPLRDRVLAGSDYPMIKPAHWRQDFHQSLAPRLKEGLEERVLQKNARAFMTP